MRGANTDQHRDVLLYVVEASLKSCETLEDICGPNYDMVPLFRSLFILEKQQFLTKTTLQICWRFEGLDEMEVRGVVRKFKNLNLLRREQIYSCIFKEEQFCVR